MIFDGLPSSLRISSARASTSGERASSSKAATSIEMGNARAATVRPVVLDHAGRGPGRSCSRRASWTKFAAAAGPLEADEVGAEQALDDRRAPRQLGEELVGRERDVQEEADGQVGPLLAEQGRAPAAAGSRAPRRWRSPPRPPRPLGEALVDLDVGVPPGPVVLRLLDDVVVQRPQRGVGHALVVAVDLLLGERDRDQRHAAGLERLRRLAGGARPADPGAAAAGHEGLERGDEPARAALPARVAVGRGDLVDRAAGWPRRRRAVRPDLFVRVSAIPPPTLDVGPVTAARPAP